MKGASWRMLRVNVWVIPVNFPKDTFHTIKAKIKSQNFNMNNIELFNDHFQNFKKYLNCKAQLIIADPPYNLGKNAYASNPQWYVDGDNKKGESEFANKEFFDTDKNFKPAEFMHFCSQSL